MVGNRPQGIMSQILLIMLFQVSLKIPHYAHCYSFYAPHCYYSIAPIADNIMHKCCNVKLQVIYITYVMLLNLKFQCALHCNIKEISML